MIWELLSQPYTLTLLFVLTLPFAAGLAILKRRRQIVYAGVSGSGLDRIPSIAARGTEAAILILCGLGLLGLFLTGEPTGAHLLNLERIAAERVAIFWIGAALTIILILIASFIAMKGHSRLGLLILIGSLSIYGLHLDASKRFYRKGKVVKKEQPLDVAFTIRLHDKHDDTYDMNHVRGEIIGADFWVGDAYLGKTPINTTVSQFWKKVGSLQETPPDYDDANSIVELPPIQKALPWLPAYRPLSTLRARPIIRFGAPEPSPKTPRKHLGVPCYAKAELDGQTIYMVGGHHEFTRGVVRDIDIAVVVPERQASVNQLLVQLRSQDYQASAEWIDAMLAFESVGEVALGSRSGYELELKSVLEQVIDEKLLRQFGYRADLGPDKARELFESVFKEVAGNECPKFFNAREQLLRRLAVQLDPAWLVDEFKPYIRTPHFIYSRSNDPETVWPRSLKVAIFELDRHLDEHFPDESNLLEAELVPEELRWHATEMLQGFAGSVGGPHMENFLFRLPAMKNGTPTDAFYAQIQQPGDRGREVRERYQMHYWSSLQFEIEHHPGIPKVFIDRPFGPESMARKFWESDFKRKTLTRFRSQAPNAWFCLFGSDGARRSHFHSIIDPMMNS